MPKQSSQWTDGRERHDSIVVVNGCKALAIEGGTLLRTIDGRTTSEEFASSVPWFDGSTNYQVHSTGATVDQLVEIARAIK